jgi:dephospho-CoA kinase
MTRRPTPSQPVPRPRPTSRAEPQRRPLAVAITGGIGAGKSEALRAFARHGAAVASSDAIVHRLLREDETVRAALIERWGERILDDEGEVDRSRVAEIVFADRDELSWLEGLLHPRVVRAYSAWREGLAQTPEPPAVFAVEVPLLYETGGERRFDAVAVVTAPPEVRAARRDASADRREERLLPDDEKVRRADFAYVNTGSLEELDAWAGEVVRALEQRL